MYYLNLEFEDGVKFEKQGLNLNIRLDNMTMLPIFTYTIKGLCTSQEMLNIKNKKISSLQVYYSELDENNVEVKELIYDSIELIKFLNIYSYYSIGEKSFITELNLN